MSKLVSRRSIGFGNTPSLFHLHVHDCHLPFIHDPFRPAQRLTQSRVTFHLRVNMQPPCFVSSPSSCVRRTCFIYIFLSWFIAVNLAAAAAPETTSTSSPATATIAPGTNGYKYIGCYNETTALSGTGSGTRALYGGINEVLPGEMTVEKCLGFCKSGMKEEKGYRFAGLEYSR